MIVFFIILTILFFISIIFLALCISSIEIEIKELLIDSENTKHNKIQNYLFYIRLKLLDKITWIKIKIDKNKIETIKKSKFIKMNMFNNMNKKELLQKENLKYIKEIKLKIKKLDLILKLCTTDSIFTSFSVVIIAIVISIILAQNSVKNENDKYKYAIIPKYEQKPSIKIKLNCIISIKIVHIMNVIYMLIKKRSVEYDERTSNRRAYASFDG